MKRSKELLDKRKIFVDDYISAGLKDKKQMKVIMSELTGILFITQRTIYNIMSQENKNHFNYEER